MEVLKEVILLGVGACLPIIIVACIVYGIWRSFTARHEYISGIVCCTDKYKDKTDTYLPMKIGDFTNLINIDDTDYISIFQYGNKEIKAENKDIYDQLKSLQEEAIRRANKRVKDLELFSWMDIGVLSVVSVLLLSEIIW